MRDQPNPTDDPAFLSFDSFLGDIQVLPQTSLVLEHKRGALIARLLLWTNNRYRGEQIGSFPQPCPRLSPKTSPLLEPSLLLQAIPPEYNTLRMPNADETSAASGL